MSLDNEVIIVYLVVTQLQTWCYLTDKPKQSQGDVGEWWKLLQIIEHSELLNPK